MRTNNIAHHPITVLAAIRVGAEWRLDNILTSINRNLNPACRIDLDRISGLHFAAVSILANDPEFRPLLILEAIYDGDDDSFFDELIGVGVRMIDAIFGECEDYPNDKSRNPIAIKAFLHKHVVSAVTTFVGIPGLTVQSIKNAITVRAMVETYVNTSFPLRANNREATEIALQISEKIRKAPGLNLKKSPIPLATQRFVGNCALIIFLFTFLLVVLLLAPLSIAYLFAIRRAELAEESHSASVPNWYDLRFLEGSKSVQSHLGTAFRIKPGALRMYTLKTVLWLVRVLTRTMALTAQTPRLTPTVHFARWFITDDRRLVFLTNFDGNFEGYVGEFADRLSRIILTAIWSNTEGFPPSRFLFFGGAANADAFKKASRVHGIYAPLWYSAYPDETILNLRRDMQIRDIVAIGRTVTTRLFGLI